MRAARLILVSRNVPIVQTPVRNPHDVAHANGGASPLIASVDVQPDLFAAELAQLVEERDTNCFRGHLCLSFILDVGNEKDGCFAAFSVQNTK